MTNITLKVFTGFLLVALLAVITPLEAQSKTVINLVDISGSLTDTESLFIKNLTALNCSIDETRVRDFYSVKCFRSHGKLWTLAEAKFPSRSGGRNKNIIKARNELRLTIAQGLKKPTVNFRKMGGSTDCIGALNQALLWLRDQAESDKPVVLNVFSDGLQTLGVGSLLHLKDVNPYWKRKTKLRDFLNKLEKKMENTL